MSAIRRFGPVLALAFFALLVPAVQASAEEATPAATPEPLFLDAAGDCGEPLAEIGTPAPDPLAPMSCSASWTCANGTVLSCSCPGAGSCTSGSSPTDCGYIECLCVGAPSTDRTCGCPNPCPPASKCIHGKTCTCHGQCGEGACISGRCNCLA